MSQAPDRITIHFTADVHGRVLPVDAIHGGPIRGGLARAASILEEARRRDPDAVYIDLGDLVQGTPMSYLHIKERPEEPHPLVEVLNELDCQGMVMGNHEFNFGLPWIEQLRKQAAFPILASNVLAPDGEPFFEPVLWVERGGRKVAILALTTPQVPRWEEPWNVEGLSFVGAIETVKRWLPELRERADAVVLAAHMGWDGVTDGGLEDPEPRENDIARLVQEVTGLDAILMAHTHRLVEPLRENGTVVLQVGSGAEALGEVMLEWVGDGPPRVTARILESHVLMPASEKIRALVTPAEERALAVTEEILGEVEAPFPLEGVRYRDNAMLTFLHKIQLDASGADLSSAALFRERETLEPGPFRGRDLFRIYPFENSLMVMELTVDDVRDYLEQIALVYLGPALYGEPPPLHPQVSLYNHDTLAGCEYVIDPAQPVGKRITSLTFRGEELPGDRRVTLALTSYRAQGGGGYAALRRGRVIRAEGKEVRTLIGEYVREVGTLVPEVFDNWRVEGVGQPELRVSDARGS